MQALFPWCTQQHAHRSQITLCLCCGWVKFTRQQHLRSPSSILLLSFSSLKSIISCVTARATHIIRYTAHNGQSAEWFFFVLFHQRKTMLIPLRSFRFLSALSSIPQTKWKIKIKCVQIMNRTYKKNPRALLWWWTHSSIFGMQNDLRSIPSTAANSQSHIVREMHEMTAIISFDDFRWIINEANEKSKRMYKGQQLQ